MTRGARTSTHMLPLPPSSRLFVSLRAAEQAVAPQGGGGGGGGASESELEGGHSEGELDRILQEQLARLRSSWYCAPDRGAASPRPVRCRLAGDLTWAGGGTPH